MLAGLPQVDEDSCGFLLMLVGIAIAMPGSSIPQQIRNGGSFTDKDMEVLRLKLLHLIFMDCSPHPPVVLTPLEAEVVERVAYIMRNTAKNAVGSEAQDDDGVCASEVQKKERMLCARIMMRKWWKAFSRR